MIGEADLTRDAALTQTDDTIVALATAPVPAGVAIVRLSGPLALAIARDLTRLAKLPHAHMQLVTLRDGADVLDRGYVVAFHAPRSFTGEDVVEFHTHGSLAVVDRLLAACVAAGARAALPGEFSQRAWEHGKLDLLQAEALADLISARAESSRQAALHALDGALSRQLAAIRTPLLHTLADLEARIDFAAEPHLAHVDLAAVQARLAGLEAELRTLHGSAHAGQVRLHGARVVLYGVPNAGKSTLLNALCGADRALVDPRPGTTRDTVEVQTAPDGVLVTWVDTAGLREADDPVEQAGTARARLETLHADVVVWLEDQSQPPSALEPPQTRGAVVRVRSKADLPQHPAWTLDPAWATALTVAAARGTGIVGLRQAIVAAVRRAGLADTGQVTLTRQRHVAAVQLALQAVARAQVAASGGLPLELLAADLRDAALALDELTGAIIPDDVLDAVFRQFCIGK